MLIIKLSQKSKIFLIPQINPDIQLDQFSLAVDLEESIENYDLSYSGGLDHLQAIGLNKLFILGLILTLHLSRSSGFHLLQTYLPSFIFVLLGWLGLFIPRTSVPGRVGMGMTTILTLTAMLRFAIPPSPFNTHSFCMQWGEAECAKSVLCLLPGCLDGDLSCLRQQLHV